MENWDLYDKNRIKLGETMIRGNEVPENTYHLVVHICILNDQNQMLIQHRQPFKATWGDLWDLTVGGSAVSGDTSQQAANREVLEEIGLDIDFSNIRPYFTINFTDGFDDIYIIKQNIDIKQLKLQDEEVKAVKWATKDEIFSMIDNGEFIPYHKSYIELVFANHDKYGCIK